YIDDLNRRWRNSTRPRTLTISGGLRRLDLAKDLRLNNRLNAQLQKLLGDRDNDGLIPEASVDMRGVGVDPEDPAYAHWNDYSYYKTLNHSNLIFHQRHALKIARWFKS